MRQEETAATLMSVEYSDGYNMVHRELEAKERVTDSLRYLVNNITRVIDYYNSKFPGKKIETLYITGPGAKFKGIDKLFHREIGLEVKPIDRLYSVQFAADSIGNNEDQSEYMCAIGAGIQPVGFISKERIAKQEKKSNQFSMSVVFAMSVIASVFMIVVSTLIVNAAKDERKDLQARITSLREVEKQYNESQKVKEQYKAITAMELLTINQNQYLNDLLFQLEENLPSTMLVNSLAVTSTGVSMNIFATSKISVAELLIQLKRIDLLSNISIESIESKDNDMGISIYSFAVNCQYSNKALQAALAGQ
jgi:type IV pilus assembly protein PilM